MTWVQTVEFTTLNLAGADPLVTRLSSNSFTTSPTDIPADTVIRGRIGGQAVVSQDCFSAGQVGGESRASGAVIELVNIDGALDWLQDRAAAGQPIVWRMGERGGAYPASFIHLLRGRLSTKPEVSRKRVRLLFKDRSADLATPLSANLYGGTNALPNGVDGVVGDLKGKRKPIAIGQPADVPLVCVNTSRQIYQANDGAIVDIPACYDLGRGLVKGANYVDQADMEANAPAAGGYRVWPGGGMARLAAKPQGTLSANVTQAVLTLAGCIKRVLQLKGFTAADWVDADFAAVDAATANEAAQWWVSGDDTAQAVLNALCQSAGLWWMFDDQDRFRLYQIEAPAGDPVMELTDRYLSDWDFITPTDITKGVPPWQVNVDYARCWSPQTGSLDVNIAADRKAFLAQEWRRAQQSNNALLTPYPNSQPLNVQTAWLREQAGQAECARLTAQYGTTRHMMRGTLRAAKFGTLQTLTLGACVLATYRRDGAGAKKLFRITGREIYPGQNRAVLTLWG